MYRCTVRTRQVSGIIELMSEKTLAELKIAHDLDNLTETELYPLTQPLGRVLKKGVEFEVWEYGDDWVVKKGIHPEANTLEQLKIDKADYEFFKNYIAENLPQTFHFRTIDRSGQESNFILQRKVKGKHLYELTDDGLRDTVLKENLLRFLVGVEKMWEETGRVPDLCKKGGTRGLKFFDDIRYSRNVMVDKDNKVWLVDTSANPLVFSKKAKLRYKYVPYVLVSSVRRLKKNLR